jgi:hypothetical protein
MHHKLASRSSLPHGIPAHIALARKPAPKPEPRGKPKPTSTLFRGVGTTCMIIIVSYLLLITLG